MLDAALKAFSANGFRKTTLEDIASEAGIAASTIYNYFADKNDIYAQACIHAVLKWQNWVKDRVAGVEGAYEKLLVMGRESFQYIVNNPELRKLLKDDPELFPLFQGSPRYPEIEVEAVEMLRAVLGQGIEEGVFRPVEVEPLTQVIFSIYRMFVVEAYLDYLEVGEHELFDVALDTIMNGIRGEKNRPARRASDLAGILHSQSGGS